MIDIKHKRKKSYKRVKLKGAHNVQRNIIYIETMDSGLQSNCSIQRRMWVPTNQVQVLVNQLCSGGRGLTLKQLMIGTEVQSLPTCGTLIRQTWLAHCVAVAVIQLASPQMRSWFSASGQTSCNTNAEVVSTVTTPFTQSHEFFWWHNRASCWRASQRPATANNTNTSTTTTLELSTHHPEEHPKDKHKLYPSESYQDNEWGHKHQYHMCCVISIIKNSYHYHYLSKLRDHRGSWSESWLPIPLL